MEGVPPVETVETVEIVETVETLSQQALWAAVTVH